MKVFVSFKPNAMYDNFEGARLRKSIKGALEVFDVAYANEENEEYDIAHFVSPIDEASIDNCIRRNIPVVVSALYCESDKYASFLEYKSTERGGRVEKLTLKALRVLNKASLVTVPSKLTKEFLQKNGVTTPIEVLYPTVNLSRFTVGRELEKQIFYRYYQEDEKKKLVVCLGSYANTDGIQSFIKLASKYKDVSFYYFSQDNAKLGFKLSERVNKHPKNLHFKKIPPDDIYRSAIINADAFTYYGYDSIGITTLLEAMAAKCEVVIRKQPLFEDLLIDNQNCHIGEFSETLSSILSDYLDGTISPTNEKGFEFAATLGLDVFGKRLKEIYRKLLKEQD